MSTLASRSAFALPLLLATLGWSVGTLLPAHAASTQQVSSCTQTSLVTAIKNAGAGGTVQFALNCPSSTPLTLSSTITLGQNVTVDGNGHKVTISGGGAVRVFAVNKGVIATLNELAIINGSAPD